MVARRLIIIARSIAIRSVIKAGSIKVRKVVFVNNVNNIFEFAFIRVIPL